MFLGNETVIVMLPWSCEVILGPESDDEEEEDGESDPEKGKNRFKSLIWNSLKVLRPNLIQPHERSLLYEGDIAAAERERPEAAAAAIWYYHM